MGFLPLMSSVYRKISSKERIMNHQLSRRHFLQEAAIASGAVMAATSASSLLSQSLQASVPQAAGNTGNIKVGCLSWVFHSLSAGQSPVEAIDLIGGMGFDGIELIISAPQDIKQFWTDDQIGKIRRQLDQYKLEVSQFAFFQPVVEDLTSLDVDKRNIAIDRFEAGTVIAKKLGSNIVNIVAPWPRELNQPGGGYLPRYYDLSNPQKGQKFELLLDDSFDWNTIWSQYVDTTKACLERVKAHGMRFSIEHHTHCVIPDANSFLLLWNEIRDEALGFNLDVGWTQSQREYPPVAIHKVKGHLFNLHMRDIDGLMRRFVQFGEGVMDFAGIIKALKKTGFSGFISLEQDGFGGDMKENAKRYLAAMRELIG